MEIFIFQNMFLYLFTLSHFSKLVVLPGTFLCSQQITWNMFEKGFVSGEILSEFIQFLGNDS